MMDDGGEDGGGMINEEGRNIRSPSAWDRKEWSEEGQRKEEAMGK